MGLRSRFRKGRMVKRNHHHMDANSDMTHTDCCSDSETVDHHPENGVSCALHEDSSHGPRQQPIQPAAPRSPTRRQRRKAQKKRFRELLGIDDPATAGVEEIVAEDKNSIFKEIEFEIESSLHYFWFSRFWILIYATLLVSILAKQPVLLHGITFVILWHMLECVVSWGMFLTMSREATESLHHFRWMYKFALSTLEKALEGDRLRGFLATKTVHFWTTGTGMDFVMRFMRAQSHEIRTQMLKESRESLERQIKLKRQILKETRGNLEHSIKSRLIRQRS